MVNLQDLIAVLPDRTVTGPAGRPIQGITYDSRRVEPGFLFVAIRGLRYDGHSFIAEAVARGAAAVVGERPLALEGVPYVQVPSSRLALGLLASAFYGHPSASLVMVGVTGTNGKTTTTHLIRWVLEAGGHPTGLIGTVHNIIAGRSLPVERTTPEAADLQKLLAAMRDEGMTHAVMEVSSHALALQRVAGCAFDVGVFTNLTQDHLDFHASMEDYAAAKARLFSRLGRNEIPGTTKPGPKAAVINADDPWGEFMAARSNAPVVTYGLNRPADITARQVEVEPGGIRFILVSPQGEAPVRLRLTGRFNVYNALAAAGAGLVLGLDPATVARGLESLQAVPGRLERIDRGQPFAVIVDYAHTPDGLENVLRGVRELAGQGRVICVFGCGGDRDRGKRPQMGAISARLADYTVLTSDNPRSEDPEAILDDIETGVRRVPGAAYERVTDRAAAIRRALELARPGDVVVIAGKGHEDYQIFADRTIHFDDREVAAEALAALGYRG
ncbi:UDP-N-acetylmuramoyl-L-alanyl-D-glutamate--2,6-diaminopimelate ligase [Thermaerobacter sp. PB12/4term]|uniref:UDP-N-acetylmuramoyl-L-alanyl-D-glutamate--2, 6-diaminopimelate ligase n=1 Tax=Thermaerobacter sp. PB12/4term TaxID=2293838 RepID=UPI000E32A805|nr:UDP-N-acetylmuramoyl-L-alanyl-D-glutamate--2,6-diaminopimelate ligase [Thermaerobacter sp. PB12/4term]QIA26841.1 UDP-N-acetylmuramoyl-L-alanyl-D-glutamate--2,6-diaminopimelate ligase [Thermaerobacter sp. PB12/4term]